MREQVGQRSTLLGVVSVTAVALLGRLVGLGDRTMHFDEARVGFRILEYAASGVWQYDAIVHGPFVFQVNRFLFGVFGASDFVARLPVALVGGLLPATAWLFRNRLRDVEVVALAGFLALNPILIYYSRFMRNDVLVAAFAFAAFGFALRLLETRDARYLYAASLALALAFTTKENALIYVGMWIGALGLLFDDRLFVTRESGRDPGAAAAAMIGDKLRALWVWRLPIVVALLEFLAVIVVFYAPRPDLYQAVGNPTLWPGVIGEATLGSWNEFVATWAGSQQGHAYLPFLRDYLQTLRVGALAIVALGLLGFVVDRYRRRGPTPVVAVASYWGLASVFVYPLATDIQAGWTGVHAVVPLAVPAAIGVGLVVDQFRDAITADDAIAAGLAGLVVIAIVGQVVFSAVTLVYLSPQSNTQLVQFGQPADDMSPAIETVEAVARQHEGTDVLFVGLKFNNDPGSLQFDRLPWPWYLKAMNAEVEGTAGLERLRSGTPPPVVIVPGDAEYVGGYTESDVKPYLDEYKRIGSYAITLKIPGNVVYTVVYVRESALPDQ